MKDRRLDVFFEHCSFRMCKHFLKNHSFGWCKKQKIEGSSIKVDCDGDIAKCELEEYTDSGR